MEKIEEEAQKRQTRITQMQEQLARTRHEREVAQLKEQAVSSFGDLSDAEQQRLITMVDQYLDVNNPQRAIDADEAGLAAAAQQARGMRTIKSLEQRRKSEVELDAARAIAKARNTAEQLGISTAHRLIGPPRSLGTEDLPSKKVSRKQKRSLDESAFLERQKRQRSSAPSSSGAPEALDESLQQDEEMRVINAYTPSLSDIGTLTFESQLVEDKNMRLIKTSTGDFKGKRKRADSTAISPLRKA